jgi:hypothetical protein
MQHAWEDEKSMRRGYLGDRYSYENNIKMHFKEIMCGTGGWFL